MAAPLKVEFHFDFGSPNAYLAELALPEIEKSTGVKFDHIPVLLGGVYKATGNMSPGESLRGIKNKPEYNALETGRSGKFLNTTNQAQRAATGRFQCRRRPRLLKEVWKACRTASTR
jgi:2-hydroxychromene-2-carboxylate isomerase